MKNQTFGIEIETTGLSRETVSNIIANYFGTTNAYAGGTYDTWTAKDNNGRTWKCMNDSSICRTGNGVCELVSPILTYDDMEDLQEIVRRVRRAGAKSDAQYQCGIHVHIGQGEHTIATLKNLVNLMAANQDVIYKALQIGQRERWCQKLESVLVDKFNAKNLNTMRKGEIAWYGSEYAADNGKRQHYNSTRYHGLNLHSVFSKGTIEFRLFNGTLHAGKIRAYVCFCLAMSNMALTKKSIRRSHKNRFNDKYNMYLLIHHAGLKGEEFKNVREHLIGALEGEITHEGRYI